MTAPGPGADALSSTTWTRSPPVLHEALASGLIAVIVVVVVAVVVGVAVLVITNRRKSGKYKKVEIKELGEIRQ